MSEPVRMLCTGDLHLGRYPSRVPTERRELSVASVWGEVVSYAISQDVDAVVLTGDVVDRENRFYESFGPLQRGLQRLADHHIRSVAVAGNHDFDVLPRLSDALDAEYFTLLGRGGMWESCYLEREEPVCRLVGWSFPAQHYARSPLADFGFGEDEVPTIGVLHGDYEQEKSQYAPVTRAELDRLPVHGWLLGHVHKPGPRDARGFVLYPGSLQPLDPGEEGRHDPWLLEISREGEIRASQVSLSTVRYEHIPVDVSDVAEKEELDQAVVEAIRDRLQTLTEEQERLKQVSCRLEYRGSTSLYSKLEAYSRQVTADLTVPFGEATATVDEVEVSARPSLDLSELARGSDPPGVLARLILDLETAESDGEPLLRKARKAMQQVHKANAYEPLLVDEETAASPTGEEVRQMLLRQGRMLLSALLKKEDQN